MMDLINLNELLEYSTAYFSVSTFVEKIILLSDEDFEEEINNYSDKQKQYIIWTYFPQK